MEFGDLGPQGLDLVDQFAEHALGAIGGVVDGFELLDDPAGHGADGEGDQADAQGPFERPAALHSYAPTRPAGRPRAAVSTASPTSRASLFAAVRRSQSRDTPTHPPGPIATAVAASRGQAATGSV